MSVPRAPIGVMSAMVLMALDATWGSAELGASASVIGIISLPFLSASVFVVCTLAVTLLQRYVDGDGWGAAIAKGIACGVLAGVPFPVMGPLIGTGLIGWSGMHRLTDDHQTEPPPMLEDPGKRRKRNG